MNKLEQFQNIFDNAKIKYAEIMKGENDAAILFKWIAENDINEWNCFHEPNYLHGISTLEGWIGLYHFLHHALYDDGDVTFVKTRFQGPKIIFYNKNEHDFENVFYKNVYKNMKKSFTITGYLNSVKEFIEEYNRHEKEIEELYKELENE